MAVYVSTRAPGEMDLARTLARYRALGFERIELSGSHLPAQDVRRLFEGATEHYLVHGLFPPPEKPFWPNISAGDPDVRERSLRHLKQTLYFCRDLGVPLLSFSPGYALYTSLLDAQHPASGPIPQPEAQLHLLRSLDQLAAWSENLGIKLALDVQNGLFQEQMIVRPSAWQAVRQALQAPHVGILLDLGHIKLASRQGKFDPDDAVEAFLPDAWACRLHAPFGEDSWEVSQLVRERFARIPVILDSHPLSLPEIERAVAALEDRLPVLFDAPH